MKSLSTEQLFADLFAFFFFIRIQFKVQHVNSVAKIGKKTIASKLFCYFFVEAIFSEACANKKDCLERQPSSVIKILQQFLEYRNEKKEVIR